VCVRGVKPGMSARVCLQAHALPPTRGAHSCAAPEAPLIEAPLTEAPLTESSLTEAPLTEASLAEATAGRSDRRAYSLRSIRH
jgi:hypothetical protein